MSRRRLLVLLIVLGLVASGCGSIRPDSIAFAEEERPGRTVLRIASHTSTGLIDAVEQWEREHPTAEVLIDRRDPDDHHGQILDPSATTMTPDIVLYDADHSATFRNETSLFADLAQFGASEFEDDSLAWRWQQGIADDDAIVALPLDVGGLTLAFRTDLLYPYETQLLERAENWCDLIAAGDRYSDRTGDAFLAGASDLFEAVLDQATIQFHNADGRLIHSTNPAVRNAWDTTMRALGERPLFEDPCPEDEDILRISANISTRSDEWDEGLRTGDFAAVLASAPQLETIRATAPSTSGDWNVLPVPDGGAGNSGGSQIAIHADSPHKELAYNLLAHLAEPTTQLRVYNEVGHFPAAQSLYESPQLTNATSDFFPQSPIGQILIDSVTAFVAAPDGPEHQLILDEFRAAVARVEAGNQTPEEAWNEALWRIELLLD